MGHHRNFGGTGQRQNQMSPGGIDLSQIRQIQQQQEIAVNQLIVATSQQIYSELVARLVTVNSAVDEAESRCTPELFRKCAQIAVESAPFLAEKLGLVNIGIVDEKDAVDGCANEHEKQNLSASDGHELA